MGTAGPSSEAWTYGPPGAPNPPSVAVRPDGSLRVTWAVPALTGGRDIAVDRYRLYRDDGAPAVAVPSAGTTTLYDDAAIAGGRTYRYAVAALNGLGEGPRSDLSAAVSTRVPGAPAAPSAAVQAAGTLRVSWSAPAFQGDGGILATRYLVYRNNATLVGSVSATYYDDASLQGGASYLYTVSAVNVYGEGPRSAPSAPAIAETAPGTPLPPGASVVSSGTLRVAWAAPASNGGSALTGYALYRDGQRIGGVLPVTPTWYDDTGLVGGTSYTYAVAAINQYGSGPTSSSGPSPAAVALSVPGAPAAPGVSVLSNGVLRVAWSEPANKGGGTLTISGFRLYRGDGTLVLETAKTQTSYDDTGRVGGTTYSYAVAALNSFGEGPKSDLGSKVAESSPTSTVIMGTATSSCAYDSATATGGNTMTIFFFRTPAYPPVTKYHIRSIIDVASSNEVQAYRDYVFNADFSDPNLVIWSGDYMRYTYKDPLYVKCGGSYVVFMEAENAYGKSPTPATSDRRTVAAAYIDPVMPPWSTMTISARDVTYTEKSIACGWDPILFDGGYHTYSGYGAPTLQYRLTITPGYCATYEHPYTFSSRSPNYYYYSVPSSCSGTFARCTITLYRPVAPCRTSTCSATIAQSMSSPSILLL